ncbi:hypothetical protein [Streptomyces virginiae]|uniref:hypothetical protein n=1 Tax=Streptomyces virginiae TaxID=1961 RepID=UPI0037A5CE44
MDLRPPVPARRLGPHPLTEDGVAALLARYEFADACVRRVVLDQEFGPKTRGRVAASPGCSTPPPQFTRFDGLLQVDLCPERFGSLRPGNAREAFEGSELVFAATGGTWSALRPWGP